MTQPDGKDSLLIEEGEAEAQTEDVFVFPASFAQQRLWFLDQFEPESPFYNIPMAVRLRGLLDRGALEQALNEVIRRHEILRTTFVIVDQEPAQVIAPAMTLTLTVSDLSLLPAEKREAEVHRLSTAEAHRPFDLASGPLLRSTLLYLGEDEHVLLFTTHHIVSDGWSVGILIREVATLYGAFSHGQPSPLPELTLQYADYAQWQREWLQGEVLEEQLQYWREQLADAPALLELPTDRPRPPLQTHRGALQTIQLSRELTDALKALGQREGVTLFMTLLAAFQTLLSRYTGAEDIVVGSPIAGRNRAEVEHLIGFFINTLVLRTRVSAEQSFRELLGRVREVALGAYAHQDVPFEMLVDELQPERSLSHSPLFQVIFILQNVQMDSVEVPGLRLNSMGVDIGIAKFDLNLAVVDAEAGLSALMRYNTDLFDAETIRHMLRCFQVLLEEIVTDPDKQLSDLSLLSAADRRRLTVEWNQTTTAYPHEHCLHQLFEEQAARTPDAISLRWDGQQLTYRQLNERANQLAHHLRTLGVGAEVLVAILMERSAEMMIAVLGVLKAGGAYVPLDPAYPLERLNWMIEDSGVKVLLTQESLRERADAASTETVCLDSEWEVIARQSAGNPESAVGAENLAYIIYTSGSTGQPKGVLVTHRSVVNHNIAVARQFGFCAADRCLQFHSMSFDAAVEELFPLWFSGGSIVLLLDRLLAPGAELLRLLAREEITILNLPTSYWHELVNALSRAQDQLPECLRLVIVGGEKAEAKRFAAWCRLGTDRVRWVNTYGPTEATVTTTVYEPPASAEEREALLELPIGRPIANAKTYILDTQLQAVPVGVAGELHIGGDGLARGYLNRAEQTVERFIPDPFSQEKGARLYKSGDLARFLPDGNIQYLGRRDHQVKVRGFRIEPGEIEAALSRHPALGHAVAVAADSPSGDKRLLAYLTAGTDEPRPSASELRSFLSTYLPDYMIPAVFVWLEQMPLTAGGKVDRRALPAPDQSRPQLSTLYRPPQTPLEELLARMWQQSLGVESVGRDDNFFELGGDSIRAAVFINKLQEELDAYIYVVAIFDAPTIAALSAYLMTHYAEAVAHLCGAALESGSEPGVRTALVDETKIREFVQLIPHRVRSNSGAADNGGAQPQQKNRRAIFILSPPRSGSTLLRVMLGGHPRLFAPPELELLSFDTLAERSAAFEGRNRDWLEGVLRALMQLHDWSADEAKEQMQRYQEQGLSTREFYHLLQDALGERLLVDKTVSYALDIEILKRAEEEFEEAVYLHLIRHPHAMIRSFEEAHLDQVFFRYSHPFSRSELAELIWLTSHRNIRRFLSSVPDERQLRVVFEELVKEPRTVMQEVCRVLEVEWEEAMLEPYREKRERMTDGIHPAGKMVGDVKFHEHGKINEEAAGRWREQSVAGRALSEQTWEEAQELGYEREEDGQRERGGKRLGRLKRVSREEPLVLSFAQQRLWFLDQLEPGSSIYNIPVAVHLGGRLDVEALERTFTEITRRHESLRTSFANIEGQPRQVISPHAPFPLPLLDLSSYPVTEREAEARRLATEEAQGAFDLAQGPLVRAHLLRLGEEDHVLLWTMHHIIFDGWSLSVLVKEVAALYAAFSTGQESPLDELPIQYADYAYWQREWLQGEVLEEQLQYWREHLRDAPAVLELPTDHPRPAVQTFNGAHQSLMLSEELREAALSLSRAEGVTLFMLLLAGFKALLYRYSGEEEIVTGTPIAGRNRAEVEHLIGFFVNTLVLRTKVSTELSFRELLRRVREVALGAYAHQDVPFEMLVEELQPVRSLSSSPLFQVVFTLHGAVREEVELPGLKMQALAAEAETAKFDLTLSVMETTHTLVATLEYNTDLFEKETIKRMLDHFEHLLSTAVADPQQKVSELALLSDEERHQLTVEWNQTHAEYPHHLCIHQLFEAQVLETPHAIAVSDGEHTLTYAELNRRSNQLAHFLQRTGVGPEHCVGIFIQRSVEMVVSILGVLKAGGAYLPLDPAYPAQRLSFMMEDAGVRVVLTAGELWEAFDWQAVKVLQLDSKWEEITKESTENASSEAASDNLAYVMYTSGSTGQPKGVCIIHRSVIRLVRNSNYIRLSSADRVACAANPAFDASTFELWGALLNGAQLVIINKEVALSPAQFVGQLQSSRVSALFLTTALFNQLAREAPDGLAGLRQVMFGGEAVDPRWVKEIVDKGKPEHLQNVYGPTESTTFASWEEVLEVAAGGRTIPIGRALSNTQLYVLDAELQPVPIGIAGELYIGGDGLARDYLNRAELTAERFIPHPFSHKAGERLYRTGDVVRWLADARLEYLGRADQQVKIRGYRIEVGEIEAALCEHHSVKEAVVLARQDSPGEKRLVAYVVSAAEQTINISQLRAHLRERVPDYMLPGAWVELPALPLTPSGKVDRRALPAPEHGRRQMEEKYVAARTPIEQALCEMWSEILKVEGIGINDNFFELSGHSLQATQMLSRVRRSFEVEIPLRRVFEEPTIASLAERIEAALRSGEELQAPPITPVTRSEELPLSFAQQRLWFLDQFNPGSPFYNIPAAVRLSGELNISALEQTLSEIIRRHESLRTTFAGIDGQPVQKIHPPSPLMLEVVDLSTRDESEREDEARRLATAEAQRAFDLAQGPLVRAQLLRLGEEDHVLLWTMHHIISDGWSLGILIREVALLYEAFSVGQQSPLEELSLQYADYAHWQREWLQGEVLEEQLTYWLEQLKDLPSVLELPTDHPRPAVQTFHGAYRSLFLGGELRDALTALSRAEGVTLFMTLLAAFQTLLSRYTAERDIVIGSPIAGRNRAEVEHLIGFFVNTLVLRTKVGSDLTFRQLLAQVRETTLGAYAHQDVPFEMLVEELRPVRSLSYSPLFQVMFALQNAPREDVELTGLRMSGIGGEGGAAKFDLTLSMMEREEGMVGALQYNTDLFEAETIALMLEHFERLLRAVVADTEQPIGEIGLLSAAEREEVLYRWNEREGEYPRHSCIHQLFETQVARSPEAVAVVCASEQLTYGELNARANQVAHQLREMGIRSGERVGICLEHSIETVVGILGVMKAGAGYVPFDTQHPMARLSFMVEDANISLLLTQQHMAERFTSTAVELLCIDTEWEMIAQQSSDGLPAATTTTAESAYLIYTSGSTGEPKAVMVSHQSLVNYIYWAAGVYLQGEGHSFALYSSLAFDLTVTSIFTPLMTGNTIFIYRTEGGLPPLLEILEDDRVGVLKLTPSHLSLIKERDNRGSRVKRLIVGGEALTTALAREVSESFGGEVEIYNEYGPTEATVGCMIYQFDAESDVRVSVPIGVPAANTRIYVLDDRMEAVAENVLGEIYIGGEGLAIGYLNRAEQTAERFVPDPFSSNAGARLYRTGDMGRRLRGGQLEYVGRLDEQVKIRGYRIEVGEIEAALCEHHSVKEAVVLARQDSTAEKRLVAYLVSAPEQTINISQLRAHLRERLPDYMLPGAMLEVSELPLTPNGKVDRRALPEPEQRRGELSGEYVAARTPIEEALCEMWREILKIEGIGVNDNFFELGGHSLQATQVLSRVRRSFEVEIPLRRLFEEPTIAGLAESVETALRGGERLATRPIEPVMRDQSLPLSFAQQRLWFLDQLSPANSIYNIPTAVRLSGELNTAALEQALSEIIRRHESLRTTFANIDGEPVQVIAQPAPLPLSIIDLRTEAEAEREAQARGIAAEEGQRGFDLEAGPLVRAQLLRLGEEDHVLLWTMHHIISDGWSLGILIREVALLYEAFSMEQQSPLEELTLQYADYAHWQREWLQGEVLEEQLSYWLEQLKDLPSVLELPTDHPRPAVQTFHGAYRSLSLDREVTESLKALSRAEGVTLFMTLLAAFQALLSRYTAERDIVIGSPIAGRNRAEVEHLIGFFVNTLVLRTKVGSDLTFKQLLSQVRETTLGAYAHQDVPFEMLVEELRPVRSLSYSPLFQVMFALQNAPREDVELSGLRMSGIGGEGGAAKFDLTLSMMEREEGMVGALQYNTDLFEAETIERMLQHLKHLLCAATAEPWQKLSQLPLLSGEERHQLICGWNDTATDYSHESCIHQLFEAQAERNPDNLVLSSSDECLSYAELNRRANQLAHHLRLLGVGPEMLVAILIERSIDWVIAILGALKAGAAYLSLDPAYPQARLSWLIEDSSPAVLLTREVWRERVGSTASEVVSVDGEWELIAQQSAENPTSEVASANLAYVIYTSGSTGQPKGVQVQHSSLVNLVTWYQRAYSIGPDDRASQVAAQSFDASVWELWSYLTTGASLHLPDKETIASTEKILGWLASQTITHCFLPTPLAAAVIEQEQSKDLALKYLLAGGDQLPKRPEQELSYGLINLYGPTECTVVATSSEVSREGNGLPPIGRPIANSQVYVLDAELQPVPIGVSGELYIGGEGVARGYLKRPELTAEKFIPDPFGTEAGARLYQTGDVARYRSHGELEYLGRRDQQVKVRGYRIELGEIESALREHHAVRESVVLARQDSPGEKRLVAYLVSAEGENLSISELRADMYKRVPEYMVPSQFVELEQLPLTPSGKIDRRALPAPGHFRPDFDQDFVAPRTPIETTLVQIWSAILKIEGIGINDNFFELGGHSLQATQVLSRVRRSFEVEIPLRRLFEEPTIARLAGKIEETLRGGGELQAPPITPVTRDQSLPLSFAQQRLWFLDQLSPANSIYNIPTAVRLTGELNTAALEQALSEIIRRHESLRTTFANIDGEPVQIIAQPAPLPLSIIDLRTEAEAEREAQARGIAAEEGQRGFDLEAGPLVRAQLLRLGEEDHVLLWTMHHIISDGWSLSVLIKEVAALYMAFTAGEPSPLEELPIQYADYAHWQREWLQGEVLEEQLSYWREQLKDLPAVLELPTDHPRPAVQTFNGAHRSLALDREVTESLKALSQAEGVTLFMTLLAAFQTLLSRYTAEQDIVIGTPIAGRNRAEVEQLIGFFVNTLVLRTRVSADLSFRQLLQGVRETTLGAYAHQDVPFEMLVEELRPIRSLSYSPLFQVMFALQNAPREDVELTGLRMSGIGGEGGAAKFDLTLSMMEREEGIVGALQYNTDLFEAETIERTLEHFRRMVEAIIADPDTRVGYLPLLTATERRQVVEEWNATDRLYPQEKSIHQLFEEQAALTPDAVALEFEHQQLTYAELNRRANRLAHYLRALGVRAESAVGIMMERSPEMIVGLLGVLKAGGAYVPLDPEYPQERLAFMLEDAGVRVLLSQRSRLSHLSPVKAEVICLDEVWAGLSAGSEENPESEIYADNLAYITYTSGSTGQPKGVQTTHRGVVRLVRGNNYARMDAGEVFLQFASLAFDASTFEIWGSLLNGARLVVMPAGLPTLEELGQVLNRHRVTILWLTAGLFNLMVDERLEDLCGLRQMLAGGDVLSVSHARRFLRAAQDCTLINGYGPTESTTFTCCHRMNGGDEFNRTVPIGRPIANTQVYILDANLQPVAIGAIGHLHVGGDGLARAYLNRAAQTARSFIPHPFSRKPGERLYKTGDLARYLPNGEIEFIGRVDNQVKVRGYRIELGEIEAVITESAQVKEAVVLAREDEPGEKRLVAYVVGRDGLEVRTNELRELVRERLPEYMLPTAFVILEEIPLTPNGKVDRRALPAPGEAARELGQLAVSPRDNLEAQLVQMWEGLLGIAPIGVTDNFFDLGGHSLAAVRLIAQVKQQFGQELPLATLFQRATVEQLASLLRSHDGLLPWSPLVEIQRGTSERAFFCVHPAGGTVFSFRSLARRLGPQQTVYGLQPLGLHAEQQPSDSIEEMAAHYLLEVRAVQPQGPYHLGGASMGGIVAFEMARQLHEEGQEVALLAMIDSWAPVYIPEPDEVTLLAQLAGEMGLSVSSDELRMMEPHARLSCVIEQAQSARAIPPDVGVEQARRWLHLFKTHVLATRNYVPQVNPVHIMLFRAAERSAGLAADPSQGWEGLAAGGIEIYEVPGNHYTMLREPHVMILADHLLNRLH